MSLTKQTIKILIVEDDISIAEIERYYFDIYFFEVYIVDNCPAGMYRGGSG